MKENKYTIKKTLLGLALLLGGTLTFTSCNSADEVPPLRDETLGSKTFKMPSPETLNSEEQSVIDAIKDEYNKAINE